jgi:hypothetical protein
MPLIKIDEIELNSEDLSENGNKILALINFTDLKINKLNDEILVKKVAKKAYELELRQLIAQRTK